MKILKDSAIYVIGNIINKLLPFLLLPYLSRKLGVDAYGQLSYYESIAAFLFIIIGLSQDNTILRYFYRYGKHSLNLIITSYYLYSIIVSLLLLTINYFWGSALLGCVIVTVTFQILLNIQLSIRQCYKKPLIYMSMQIISTLIVFITTIIFLEIYRTHLVEKRFLAILIGNATIFIIACILFMKKNYRHIFNLKQYKASFAYLFTFSAPLLLYHFSDFLKSDLDKILIYQKYSADDLGVYGMAFKLSLVISVLILSLNKAIVPHYFESLKNNKLSASQVYRYALKTLLFIPIAIGLIFCTPEKLFLWVIGDEFIGIKYYFTLFATSALLNLPYLLLINYLFYFGKTKYVAIIAAISTLVYLCTLLIFINFGVAYVPFANVIGTFTNLPLTYFFIRRLERLK